MTRAECLTEVQEKKGAKANANRRNWPCVSREEGTDSSVSKRKPLLAIESKKARLASPMCSAKSRISASGCVNFAIRETH